MTLEMDLLVSKVSHHVSLTLSAVLFVVQDGTFQLLFQHHACLLHAPYRDDHGLLALWIHKPQKNLSFYTLSWWWCFVTAIEK